MKLLFIENKYQTEFWELIANSLLEDGHNIFWIVQNHNFTPNIGEICKIPYPKERDLLKENGSIDQFDYIVQSDRNLNYFGKSDNRYYSYYSEKILNCLTKIKPDIIFGESTLFHELLTIHHAKNLDILYLAPSSSRYPKNRFSFYKYNTLEPFGGDEIALNKIEATKIIDSIANRSIKPDYMEKVKVSRISMLRKSFRNFYLMSKSYYQGEKYNLPSPFIKFEIERKKENLKKKWNVLSENFTTKELENKFCLLFPMQLQPEANIDVWGYQYRNQLEIIKNLLKSTSKDTYIIVKPNPKAKYEINNELISFIRENKRVIPVPLNVSMDDVIDKIEIVVTVTGTIAIECILSNKPVVTLKKTIYNDNPNCVFISDINSVLIFIERVKANKFPRICEDVKINFINKLKQSSYQGILTPPRFNAKSADSSNLNSVINAFKSVILAYKMKK